MICSYSIDVLEETLFESGWLEVSAGYFSTDMAIKDWVKNLSKHYPPNTKYKIRSVIQEK